MNEFDKLADELIERKYQLRVEHNHSDMKWYAYYSRRGQRTLFENDLYGSGEDDWKTASDTPTEALAKLKELEFAQSIKQDREN